jgi:hypothetical protein
MVCHGCLITPPGGEAMDARTFSGAHSRLWQGGLMATTDPTPGLQCSNGCGAGTVTIDEWVRGQAAPRPIRIDTWVKCVHCGQRLKHLTSA